MRTRTLLVLTLACVLSLTSLSGCACSSQTTEPAATEPAVSDEAPAAEKMLPLENEDAFRSLLAIGLERYDLTIEDGTFTVMTSMEGYGSIMWTKEDMSITITHRDVNGEWEWNYTDDGVDIDSVTPDAFTDAEKTEFMALAKRMIEAVGKDASDIAELYSWKATGGVMQADYLFGGPDEDLQIHISTDAERHLGYVYLVPEI